MSGPRLFPWPVILAIAGCGGNHVVAPVLQPPATSGPGVPTFRGDDDAGRSSADAGASTGGDDAGNSWDAGVADAGQELDAGPVSDAGEPLDAGQPVDAGEPPDAGPPRDAGGPLDAGPAQDAGPAIDAGPTPDAGARADAGPVVIVRTGKMPVPEFGGVPANLPWLAGSKLVLRDRTPGSAGDLFTLFWFNGVLVPYGSRDRGSSWGYVGAGVTCGAAQPGALAQDPLGKVHLLTSDTSGGKVEYERVALAHDGAGHVSGLSVEVNRQPLMDANTSSDVRPQLVAGADLQGDPLLILAVMDDPLSPVRARIRLLRTTASAGLAPRQGHPEDWADLDGNPGAVSQVPATDPAFDGYTEHMMTLALEQHPVSRDLHLFAGTQETRDSADPTPGIRRWRITPSSETSWSAPGAATVIASDGEFPPSFGGTFTTEHYVWYALFEPAGLRFGRIDATGAETANAIPSPDAVASLAGWAAFSVDASEQRLWALWVRRVVPSYPSNYRTFSAYWNGSHWDLDDETASATYLRPWGIYGSIGWRDGLAAVVIEESANASLVLQPSVQVIRTEP